MVSSILRSQREQRTRRAGDRTGAEAPAPREKFRCPNCHQEYGDPLYHGPLGHAPQDLCFDCWASEWGGIIQVMMRGGDWRQLDAALFLLCQGFSHHEAAQVIGVCRNTVWNWIQKLRQKPDLTPQWLIDRARSHGASGR